jgi:hypothetical protein
MAVSLSAAADRCSERCRQAGVATAKQCRPASRPSLSLLPALQLYSSQCPLTACLQYARTDRSSSWVHTKPHQPANRQAAAAPSIGPGLVRRGLLQSHRLQRPVQTPQIRPTTLIRAQPCHMRMRGSRLGVVAVATSPQRRCVQVWGRPARLRREAGRDEQTKTLHPSAVIHKQIWRSISRKSAYRHPDITPGPRDVPSEFIVVLRPTLSFHRVLCQGDCRCQTRGCMPAH